MTSNIAGNPGAREVGRSNPLRPIDGERACRVMFSIGTKVRFIEPFRPQAVAPGAVGVVVEIGFAMAHAQPAGDGRLQPLQLCKA
jgi:hypothetical protein